MISYSFGDVSKNNTSVILDVLEEFDKFIGLKVTKEKSSVIFSKNVSQESKEMVLSKTSFWEREDLDKYLGFGIDKIGNVKKEDIDDLLEKIQKKLSRWKANLLSLIGRQMLIKFILEGMIG